MGVSPRVVRSQNKSVRNIANGVVYGLVVGERAVTSIVPNTEYGTAGKALEEPVC